MKRLYVISGVTGMTGSEIARQIMLTDDEIIGFDNFFASSIETIEEIIKNEHFSFFKYDLNNTMQMEKIKDLVLYKKKLADEVIYINCAAVVHTEHFYHIERTFTTNVMGMKNFLEQAIEVGAHKFINCSTSEVYSMQSWSENGISESDYVLMATAEHSQRTSYASGKLITEFFMKEAVEKKKIKGCSVRFANVYSKNELYPKHIIPHIINSFIKGEEVVLLENAKNTKRTFLHNIDSCSAILELLSSDSALDGTIYNVATQEEITILELVGLIARKMNIKEPKVRFEGFRKSDPQQRVLSTEKIYKKVGWQPSISLDEGLSYSIEYARRKWEN